MQPHTRTATPLVYRHPLATPFAAAVETDKGRPTRVYARQRWQKVVAINNIWRVVDSWWTTFPIDRTYFTVILDNGRPWTLYWDHISSHWMMHTR